MAATYEPIATATASGSSTTVTFSSIPGTYTDLILVANGTADGSPVKVQFNSDTGSNYSNTRMAAYSTTTQSDRETSATAIYVGGLYNDQSTSIVHIMNYANTTTYKTTISRGIAWQSSVKYLTAVVGLWRSTSAITSITFKGDVNLNSVTTVTLYGVKAA
jgi:hypothetical protein